MGRKIKYWGLELRKRVRFESLVSLLLFACGRRLFRCSLGSVRSTWRRGWRRIGRRGFSFLLYWSHGLQFLNPYPVMPPGFCCCDGFLVAILKHFLGLVFYRTTIRTWEYENVSSGAMWGWILFRKTMHEDAPKVHARCSWVIWKSQFNFANSAIDWTTLLN